MPTGIAKPTTASFSPQSIRDQIRGRVRVPEGLLQEALDNLRSKLTAKETKHFSFQGSVIEKREVEALGIQMQAIELIAKMSELVTTQAPKQQAPRVEVIVDAKTGVMRIVISDSEEDQDVQTKAVPSGLAEIEPQVLEATATHVVQEVGDVSDEDFEKIIKIPRGRLDPTLRAILFDSPPEPTVGNGA